ncbi:MAG: hypothetical protein A2203_05620 [Chromatiales bacterium RIFOXYA1_FULL_46_5]|nr:MAG: hypothetical protein A2203_05620 [Chromatiales bacterium RIFOXYA1_FULL_46_5]
MKVWIFSIVVHLLLLVALMWVRFVPEQKIAESVVIHTYSYTQIRPKPVPLSVAKQIAAEKIPQQSVAPAKPAAAVAAKIAKSPVSDSKAATAVAVTPQSTEQKSPPATSVLSPPATGTLSLADRALASVTAKASEPMTERNQQREVVVRSSNPVDTDLAPDRLKPVKAFTDGSSLINANGVCWRVPPPEAGKDAIWLFAGVSCNDDTKVDQINDILQKRRTYADD